jgi:hypothetical protein
MTEMEKPFASFALHWPEGLKPNSAAFKPEKGTTHE